MKICPECKEESQLKASLCWRCGYEFVFDPVKMLAVGFVIVVVVGFLA